MATAVERHFALLGDAIAASDGVLFKTIGDAIQAAFPTVPRAVAAAVAAQLALRAEDWGDLGPLRVRMAVHLARQPAAHLAADAARRLPPRPTSGDRSACHS